MTKTLSNLLSDPTNLRFQRVPADTPEMMHVLQYNGTVELFAAAGFTRVGGGGGGGSGGGSGGGQ